VRNKAANTDRDYRNVHSKQLASVDSTTLDIKTAASLYWKIDDVMEDHRKPECGGTAGC